MAQFNVRIPKHTEEQIDYLVERKGMTQTQLAILAFDRLYQEEKKRELEDANKRRERQDGQE